MANDRSNAKSRSCIPGPYTVFRPTLPNAVPAAGAKLGGGGKGRVTSAAQVGSIAILLGTVHKEQIVPGSEVKLEDGRVARVLGLPYVFLAPALYGLIATGGIAIMSRSRLAVH